MPNATLSPPQGTQTDNFTVGIMFDVGVTDFAADTLSVTAVSGNGITGVTFVVLPDPDTDRSTYNVSFQLPEDVAGALKIDITGMVTPVGSSTPEAVVATAVTVAYDNITNVSATLGQVEYRDGGEIAVPVTFGETVIASKTVFEITHVSGAALTGIEYVLLGEGTAYELVFTVPPDRRGSFRISADGYVLKTATGVWDNVVIVAVTVNYSTIEPELVDHRIVRTGERVDVILQYNVSCTVTDPKGQFGSDDATFADFLDYAGANLDPPNFYRKLNGDYPTLPLPAELPETDWTDMGLTTEEATIYLLRWGSVDESVEFNVTIKPGFVRGPVS